MIRGLRRKGTTSAHLIFGQHYHAGLELYDKLRAQGEAHEPSVRAVVLDLLRRTWVPAEGDTPAGPWLSDHNLKTRESLIRSVIWYLEEFGESDPIQTLILANGKPAVELTFKFDSNIEIDYSGVYDKVRQALNVKALSNTQGAPFTYTLSGHLDRVGTFGTETYVIDRKTSTGALTPHFFSQFNPHTQMSLYTIAGQVTFGIALAGVIIDGAQIAVGFTRFGRGFSPRTSGQSEEYLRELEHWFRLAETYAAQDYWPQNAESCHNYGGCPFRRICSLDPSHRETFLRNDYEVNRWNPLIER